MGVEWVWTFLSIRSGFGGEISRGRGPELEHSGSSRGAEKVADNRAGTVGDVVSSIKKVGSS